MPTPEGLNTCGTCGLPYQVGRKAAHDLKASHRAAVRGDTTVTRQVTTTVTTDQPKPETFGQRMARLRKEKAARIEQAKAPAQPGDAGDDGAGSTPAPRQSAAERRAAKVDAERAAGKRPEPSEQ